MQFNLCTFNLFIIIMMVSLFHCLHNVEEVKSFVLVKSPGGGRFYGKRLRLLTEDRILKYNADWQC